MYIDGEGGQKAPTYAYKKCMKGKQSRAGEEFYCLIVFGFVDGCMRT